MKRLLLGAAVAVSLILPAFAKNFAFPTKNPVATIVIPDNWKTEEIDYGYSARSPDDDVFFSVEFARAKQIDALFADNAKWMKENKIKDNGKPEKNKISLNGIEAEVFTFNTTDANGPTIVDFVIMSGGQDRVILLTLWASEDERKANSKDIDAMMNSIKPIN